MNILDCDQALENFGFSVFNVDLKNKTYKLLVYGQIQLDTKEHYANRILLLEQVLNDLTEYYEIKKSTIEDIQYQRNIDTYKKLAALQFFLQYYFFYRQIDCEKPYGVSTWRTGLGIPNKNGKQITFNRINTLLGQPEGLTDNMTDSIGKGIYYCKNILKLGNGDLKNAEMKVIKANYLIDGGIKINDTKRTTRKNKSKIKANGTRKTNKTTK